MARVPIPGQTKSRLSANGGISVDLAAAVAAAMLRCTVQRVRLLGRVIVACTPDDGGPELDRALAGLEGPDLRVVPQGGGDLGTRMARLWQTVGDSEPVAFLGADAPDVPIDALMAIPREVQSHAVAIGPTDDGGYWTIAGRRCSPELFVDIDWGTGRVYHQSCERARAQHLDVRVLPPWQDVDQPADLDRLRHGLRLASRQWSGPDAGPDSDALAFRELASTLDRLLPPLESSDL